MSQPDVALVFPQEGSRIVRGAPDRAGQERAARSLRLLRRSKPIAMTSVGIAAVGFVVAPTHPVSIVLYVVGAIGLAGSLLMLRVAGARIREFEREFGLPVPAEIAETVLDTHRRLGYLDEEITYWRMRPGASGLRRRLNREIDTFQAAVRDLRTTWLSGDDEGWRRAGRQVVDRGDDLDALAVEVSRLAGGPQA